MTLGLDFLSSGSHLVRPTIPSWAGVGLVSVGPVSGATVNLRHFYCIRTQHAPRSSGRAFVCSLLFFCHRTVVASSLFLSFSFCYYYITLSFFLLSL
jgi:hypothetical protein